MLAYKTEMKSGKSNSVVDRREKISTDVENILRKTFSKKVFETVVRVNTKLKACPQKKQSTFDVEKSQDKGFTDYANVHKNL
jgi:cellulose biosynthesis protein BcsQ